MNNIFENAKFGKAYKTRDGRKAIFFQFDTITDDDGNTIGNLAYVYTLRDGEYSVALNGISTSENDIILHNINTIKLDEDIVSEWQEEINKEELDRLAEEFCDEEYKHPTDVNKAQNGLELGYSNLVNCFKAGYRKAKEL